MKQTVFFLTLILAYFTLGCSDLRLTPSGVVLRYHKALQSGDIPELRATMTRDAYLELLAEAIPNLNGSGAVFEHDVIYFKMDMNAQKRLEERLGKYLKALPESTIRLIGENAAGENSREIYLERNGKREKVLLIGVDNQWKISRMPEGTRN